MWKFYLGFFCGYGDGMGGVGLLLFRCVLFFNRILLILDRDSELGLVLVFWCFK